MDLLGNIYKYPTMSMAVDSSHLLKLHRELIDGLREELTSKTLPKFLLDMGEGIKNQDNRCTADPMFEVRYDQYLITEEGYNESHFELLNENDETVYHSEKSDSVETLEAYLLDNEEGWCRVWCEDRGLCLPESACESVIEGLDLPPSLRKIHLQKVPVTVNAHFTEKDAQAFIDRKQHDYPPLYTHVTSLYFCENMKQLREWIKNLT